MENVIENKELLNIAEVQLVYKNPIKPSLRPVIYKTQQAYEILLSMWDDSTIELREEFKIILLNTANRVLGICNLNSGGVNSCNVDPKLVFCTAITANASAIILAHNHPSGKLEPSQQDINQTQKLVEGGNYLDIKILDHLIITSEGYFSFSDEGLL